MQKILQINLLYAMPFPAHPNHRNPNPQGVWGACTVRTALSPPASLPKEGDLFCVIYLYIFLLGKKEREKEKKGKVGVGLYLLWFTIVYDYFNLGPTFHESHCSGCKRYQ